MHQKSTSLCTIYIIFKIEHFARAAGGGGHRQAHQQGRRPHQRRGLITSLTTSPAGRRRGPGPLLVRRGCSRRGPRPMDAGPAGPGLGRQSGRAVDWRRRAEAGDEGNALRRGGYRDRGGRAAVAGRSGRRAPGDQKPCTSSSPAFTYPNFAFKLSMVKGSPAVPTSAAASGPEEAQAGRTKTKPAPA